MGEEVDAARKTGDGVHRRNGGEESLVLESVRQGYWAPAESGIYFLKTLEGTPVIQYYSFTSKITTQIAKIERLLYGTAPGLTVTADGRWIAWDQADREETDLMLLENFR